MNSLNIAKADRCRVLSTSLPIESLMTVDEIKHLLKGTAPRIKLVSNLSFGFRKCEVNNDNNFMSDFPRDNNPDKVDQIPLCRGKCLKQQFSIISMSIILAI